MELLNGWKGGKSCVDREEPLGIRPSEGNRVRLHLSSKDLILLHMETLFFRNGDPSLDPSFEVYNRFLLFLLQDMRNLRVHVHKNIS